MSQKKYRTGAQDGNGRAPGSPSGDERPDALEALFQQLSMESDPPEMAPDEDPMPDNLARRLMANMALLMNHIGNLCGQAIDYSSPEMANAMFKRELEREAAERAQGKERVREARHPLASLKRTAMRAAALMRDLLKATNPGMFNLVPGDVVEAKIRKAVEDAGKLIEQKLGKSAVPNSG